MRRLNVEYVYRDPQDDIDYKMDTFDDGAILFIDVFDYNLFRALYQRTFGPVSDYGYENFQITQDSLIEGIYTKKNNKVSIYIKTSEFIYTCSYSDMSKVEASLLERDGTA